MNGEPLIQTKPGDGGTNSVLRRRGRHRPRALEEIDPEKIGRELEKVSEEDGGTSQDGSGAGSWSRRPRHRDVLGERLSGKVPTPKERFLAIGQRSNAEDHLPSVGCKRIPAKCRWKPSASSEELERHRPVGSSEAAASDGGLHAERVLCIGIPTVLVAGR